jgi:hypothetical protein
MLEESLDIVKTHGFVSAKCGAGLSSKSSSPSQAPVTVLELEAPAAEAFPALLDYLYASRLAASAPASPKLVTSASLFQQAPKDLVDINTHSATALHHLSVCLQIKPLQRITTEFFMSDLSIDNLMVYYTHARTFDDVPVLERAAKVLAASILDMEQKMVIYFLQTLDAEFFLMVLQLITQEHAAAIDSHEETHKVEDKTLSVRLSLLVAIYCNLHRDELGAERLTMFERLTDEQLIPILDVKAAQVLLDIEQELKDDFTLTSLKKRCIDVMAHHWSTALVSMEEDNDPAGDGYSGRIFLPPVNGEALCHFTLMALTRAKEQLDSREDKSQEPASDLQTAIGHRPSKTTSMAHPSLPSLMTPPVSCKAEPSFPKTQDDKLLGQIIVSSVAMEEVTGDCSEREALSE